ncbi:hypothetical protein BKH46_02130 [Helicobacter sp. 12S02634-8]|uniref:KAP family P-loop NTPase fold protein n=1 Tax=Helicobacter sp. 12S02634-8 TaxID=1476199 RepID=UPI000BA7B429|nr:P-loop NTPase fold protein [Helicobacter sp. 12S02634-8]PAF48130.1 hypothetical protein BKH46_02130 [Helicobacter sp. 12S02634-8]
MAFVKDIEIDLTEDGIDLLNGKSYAVALKNAILDDTPSKEAFVIGLLGEWGSGKSSIVQTAESLINKDKTKKIKFITYDAWKYIDDNFRRTFILSIGKQLELSDREIETLEGKLYTDSTVEKATKHLSLKNITILSFVIAGCFSILHWGFGMEWRGAGAFSLFGSLSISFMAFCMSVVSQLFNEHKQSQSVPYLFSPEQFEKEFKQVLSHKKAKKFKKIVFIIDNIDRCDSETAYRLLTNVKTFMVKHDNIIFVIPADDESLCQHFCSRFSRNMKTAGEFLRKIFNVEIKIKPLEEIELFDFTDKINKKNNLGFSKDAINIIASEYASNPRRIIHFFNNIKSELDVLSTKLSEKEIDDVKNIVCKILIIREEWPDYYKLILNDSRLIAASEYSPSEDLSQTKKQELKSLNNFLTRTHTFKFYGNEQLLEKVLSNNSVFDGLSQDIRSAVKELEKDKIQSFVSRNPENQESLLNYIIERLKLHIIRETWATEVPNLFKAILWIDSVCPITLSMNSRLERELKGKLSNFIEYLEGSDGAFYTLLSSYLNNLQNQNKKYFIQELLTEYFDKKLTNENVEKEEGLKITINMFEAIITGAVDTSIFSKHKNTFLCWYSLSDTTISAAKLKDLCNFISDDLLQYIIGKIEKDNNICIGDFVYIVSNIKTSSNIYNMFFTKVNELYSAYAHENGDEILRSIDATLPILYTMNISSDLEALKIYVNNIFVESSAASLIGNDISEEKNRGKVIEFLAWLYKSTNNSIEATPHFEKLLTLYPDERDNVLSKLKEIGVIENIAPLAKIVLGHNIFTASYIYWMEKLSTSYEQGGYVVGVDILTKEIENIINKISSSDNESDLKKLNALLEYLLKNRVESKIAIIDTVKGMTKDTVIKLSEKIRMLFLDKICEDIASYENDTNILTSIATYGSKENIETLMSAIFRKLVENKEEMISIYSIIPAEKVKLADKRKMKPWLEEETPAVE